MAVKLLSSEEISSIKLNLPEWQIVKNELIRKFEFENFVEAFAFLTKVAIIAESMCHHPELINVYSKVTIKLTTHDLGGISDLDIKLANKINRL
tara:strand:- start:133 stop:414 length:282 start_codon:yes stop_codon:yes gene_type:complete